MLSASLTSYRIHVKCCPWDSISTKKTLKRGQICIYLWIFPPMLTFFTLEALTKWNNITCRKQQMRRHKRLLCGPSVHLPRKQKCWSPWRLPIWQKSGGSNYTTRTPYNDSGLIVQLSNIV